MRRVVGVMGAVVALAVGGWLVNGLADLTMSRHRTMPPGSVTTVVADARSQGYSEHDLRTMAQALFLTCRLEVEADVVERSFEMGADGRFRAQLTPALDESDERQLHGCLEDLRVDHLELEVVRLDRIR